MHAEEDDFADSFNLARWKPALAAAWRTGLDMLFPPQSLDGGVHRVHVLMLFHARARYRDREVRDDRG